MTQMALKRLASNPDFVRVKSWLEGSLLSIDERNRHTIDAAVLRMHQGAAAGLAEFLDRAVGKSAIEQQAVSRKAGP